MLRTCKDLSFGDRDVHVAAIEAMAHDWRPRMQQIGAWFGDLGSIARELPGREEDPPCEFGVVLGSGAQRTRYAARLNELTLLRAVVPGSEDLWLSARAAAVVVFVDETVLQDAASLFALLAVGARSERRVATAAGGDAARELWNAVALPHARGLRLERAGGDGEVDESLASALRTFVDVGSFDESAPIESIGLQKRPDVCGPVIEALRSGPSGAGAPPPAPPPRP